MKKWILFLLLIPVIAFSDIGYVNKGKITVEGTPEFIEMIQSVYSEIRDMPNMRSLITGNMTRYYNIVSFYKLKHIYGFEEGGRITEANGVFFSDEPDSIYVKEGMDFMNTFVTTIHECFHLILYHTCYKSYTKEQREQLCFMWSTEAYWMYQSSLALYQR